MGGSGGGGYKPDTITLDNGSSYDYNLVKNFGLTQAFGTDKVQKIGQKLRDSGAFNSEASAAQFYSSGFSNNATKTVQAAKMAGVITDETSTYLLDQISQAGDNKAKQAAVYDTFYKTLTNNQDDPTILALKRTQQLRNLTADEPGLRKQTNVESASLLSSGLNKSGSLISGGGQ